MLPFSGAMIAAPQGTTSIITIVDVLSLVLLVLLFYIFGRAADVNVRLTPKVECSFCFQVLWHGRRRGGARVQPQGSKGIGFMGGTLVQCSSSWQAGRVRGDCWYSRLAASTNMCRARCVWSPCFCLAFFFVFLSLGDPHHTPRFTTAFTIAFRIALSIALTRQYPYFHCCTIARK